MGIFNQIGGISTSSINNVLGGPLNSLFGTGPSASIYQYPSNLANDPSRQHWVSFTIYDVTPVTFTPSSTSVAGGNAGKEGSTNDFFGISGDSITGLSSIDNVINQAGSFIGGAAEGLSSLLTSVATPGALLGPVGQIKTHINLYMPDTLTSSYQSNYDTLELGTNNVIRALEAANDVYKKGKSQSTPNYTSAAKSYASNNPVVLEAIGKTAESLGLQGASAAILGKSGYAINPQMQMVYRGIDFRTFSLEFTMTPKNPDEAAMISKICNAFIYANAPGVTGDSNLYFTTPSQFDISFRMAAGGPAGGLLDSLISAGNSLVPGLPLGNAVANALGGQNDSGGTQGVENRNLMKFGRSICTNVSVNYAPNGWAAYSGGVPISTVLTLEFQEIAILNRKELAKKDGVK